MEKIAILTDSASNIKENISEGIFVVPLYVNFENESKKDLLEISPSELFARIDEEKPYTSAPSIEDFREKIKMIWEAGYSKILAIAVSHALSGSYNAMRLALESQDMEYVLIDSLNITMSEGLLVMYAKSLIDKVDDLDQLAKKIGEKIKDTRLIATVSDLKYLIRGGRLSTVEGLIGGTLRINPVLGLDEKGTIKNCKSVMGKKRALNFIVDETKKALQKAEKYYLAIAYGRDKEDIAGIKEKLSDLIEGANLYLEGPVTAVLGTHSGPSVYAVSFLKIK
ncbi:DegV family protein [Anaerococcus lactolyticus]|uniref:DegV family protein n=1 Tax=Anaerococcus lactolyticus TaxID=33032 RepID=UPI0023F4ADD3|nr:DegV family protein [Anaerococcus lactolyticus]